MILFGAGGHAKVIVEILENGNEGVDLIFDDDLTQKELMHLRISGKYNPEFLPDKKLIIGVGDNILRNKIANKVFHDFGNVISKEAFLSKSVALGVGNVIFSKAVIQAKAKIGNHCIINTGGQVDHDCVIGSFSHVGPGAILCGGVILGTHVLVGAGSVLIPGIKVGNNVTIGAGSVVISDLVENCTYVGNPARKVLK